MSHKKRVRGKRIHVELDRELAQFIDESCKIYRLKAPDFVRWILARQLLGAPSLSATSLEAVK